MARIVFLSDTHTYHNTVKVPEGDIVVHCGDSTYNGEIWEMKNFITWFGNLPHKGKCFINGNHEVQVWKQNLTKEMVKSHNRDFFTNIHYLEEESVEIEGVKFWGSPYTPEFFNWAYMYNRDAPTGRKRWMGIPKDVDVLITHGPGYGILDEVTPFGRYPDTHAGCPYLLEKVKQIKPKIHVFGHLHAHYGHVYLEETLCINASTCNDRYVPVNKPIVVDTITWEVVDFCS